MITLRHTTLGKTPLDERSARRRDLYLTTHTTHKRQKSIHQVGFEPTVPVSERPQTNALDGATTGTGDVRIYTTVIIPYPTAFPYGNGMVLHFYQQQESSTTKTVHKVISKGLKAYV